MKITNVQLEALQARLEEVIGPRACSFCGTIDYTISNTIVLQQVTDDPAINKIGGPAMPLAILTCTKCAHVDYFNLIVLGLRDIFGLGENDDSAS